MAALQASKLVVIPSSPSLVEVLRSTLKQLEQNEDLASDDPALNELKGSILRTITELEVVKAPSPAAQQKILWITPRPRTIQLEPHTQPDAAAGEEESSKTAAALAPVALSSSGKASGRKPRSRSASPRRSGAAD